MESELLKFIKEQKKEVLHHIPTKLISKDVNNDSNELSNIFKDGMYKAFDLIISKTNSNDFADDFIDYLIENASEAFKFQDRELLAKVIARYFE